MAAVRSFAFSGAILAMAVLPLPIRGQGTSAAPRVMSMVPLAPTPFAATGGVHLEYELHITNLTGPSITLREVEALTGNGQRLATFRGELLRKEVEQPGVVRRTLGILSRTRSDAARYLAWQSEYDPTRIGPGTLAVVYMELILERGEPVPSLIRHRVTIEYEGADEAPTETVIEASAAKPRSPALVIGPPLRGGDWWVFNRSREAAHNRVLGAFGDAIQRFAIDYSKVNEFGHDHTGDYFVREKRLSIGAEVLAVADGIVFSAHDGTPENEIGRVAEGVSARGNFVDLEIAEGVHALYMHLQSGSVTVQRGDSVVRGQVISRVGHSGRGAPAPHLHFEVYEAPSHDGPAELDLSHEGLPYVHPSFEVVGENARGFDPPLPYCTCTGTDCAPRVIERRESEMPIGEVVIRFPDEGEAGGARVEDDPRRLMAVCRVHEGRLLTEQYRIPEAIAAFAEAQSLYPDLVVPDQEWRALCWRGSIAAQAADILFACDSAVAREPTYGAHLAARGLARALSGDIPRAIADLEAYLEWQARNELGALFAAREDGLRADSVESLHAQVRGWIDALRVGENPFTPDLLEELRAGG